MYLALARPDLPTPMHALSTDACWLLQRQSDVPEDDAWLACSEQSVLGAFRFAPRRAAWRLGRWTAKRLVSMAFFPGVPLANLEILAAADGAPELRVHGEASPVTLSISHREHISLCAAASGGVALGCDTERIEPRSDAFIADYFTPAERRFVGNTPPTLRPLAANLIWAAKECALKALRTGLRADTRSVEVTVQALAPSGDWQPLQIRGSAPDVELTGCWREHEGFVLCMAGPSGSVKCEVQSAEGLTRRE
jgi:4'-phosphopantetheinyl transferase